ncbi:MAG TPA: cation transporter [Chryseosolibacter sp.]|nr:cation transporter [Chryseosolibacter sp.]
MKEKYLIEGMSCAGCERSVQKTISNLPGVQSAKADLSSSSVEIEFDPAKVGIEHIKTTVGILGYKIVGELPTHRQRPGSDEGIS